MGLNACGVLTVYVLAKGWLLCIYMFMQEGLTIQRYAVRVALCVVLSLLVHGVLMWWMLSMVGVGAQRGGHGESRQAVRRMVQIVAPPRDEPQPPPFVKTDPDQDEVAPLHADFIGRRNAVESASEFTPDRHSEAPLPSQNGVEKDELVVFDQSRQDGDLKHDGKLPPNRALPGASAPPPAPLPVPEVVAHDEVPEVAPPQEGVATALPQPAAGEGDVPVRRAAEAPQEAAVAQQEVQRVLAEPAPVAVQPRAGAVPVYDPSLADHMQSVPGFRTYERRSRSTGRFVVGRRPSLNVAATPQGRYEEEIYRRIAYYWYIACDEHRGDIIPGSVVISLRINRRGLLQNMDLVRRSGASISQQSFTFAAIRRASLPPMPPAVQQEMVGDLLELIFQFNFD